MTKDCSFCKYYYNIQGYDSCRLRCGFKHGRQRCSDYERDWGNTIFVLLFVFIILFLPIFLILRGLCVI